MEKTNPLVNAENHETACAAKKNTKPQESTEEDKWIGKHGKNNHPLVSPKPQESAGKHETTGKREKTRIIGAKRKHCLTLD